MKPTAALTGITQRQAEDDHVKLFRAHSRRYDIDKRWARVRASVTIGVAVAAPIATLISKQVAITLGIVGGGWLLLDRLQLARTHRTARENAVNAHELYDITVFDLPWNAALVGRRPAPEELAEDASRRPEKAGERTWYADTGDTPRPADVLLCQRENTVWSRRLHHGFARLVVVAAVGWFLLGIAFALWRQDTLADYLTQIFLPSAPALTAAIDRVNLHRSGADARTRLQEDIARLWDRFCETGTLALGDCRRVQDNTYLLRRDYPGVPGWYYRFRRDKDQAATDAGTRAHVGQMDV